MRSFINAIVNVIRSGNRRNRVIDAFAANGVDALRASGPAYRMQPHAPRPGYHGLERPEGGLLVLQRSSLDASSAWRNLSLKTSKRGSSQRFAGTPFTACTATAERPQAGARREQLAGITAGGVLVAPAPVVGLLASV